MWYKEVQDVRGCVSLYIHPLRRGRVGCIQLQRQQCGDVYGVSMCGRAGCIHVWTCRMWTSQKSSVNDFVCIFFRNTDDVGGIPTSGSSGLETTNFLHFFSRMLEWKNRLSKYIFSLIRYSKSTVLLIIQTFLHYYKKQYNKQVVFHRKNSTFNSPCSSAPSQYKSPSQSAYRGRVAIGGVYLPSKLERTPQLCTWW